MKKIILLLFLVFAVFVFVNRQKLFLRDPLGSVVRDGVKEDGAQVYINYSNDVLLQNDKTPAYMTVVQAGDHFGTPLALKCVHWVVCLADGDPVQVIDRPAGMSVVEMSGKLVEFRDARGRDVQVKLR